MAKEQQKQFANIIFFESSDPMDFFERCMNCNIYKLEANALVRRPSSKPQMLYIAVHTSLKEIRGIARFVKYYIHNNYHIISHAYNLIRPAHKLSRPGHQLDSSYATGCISSKHTLTRIEPKTVNIGGGDWRCG